MSDHRCVGVLMGGDSAEREISLKSGQAVLDSLLRSGIDAVKVDTQGNAIDAIESANIDVAFVILHGRGGEDGTIQGVLEHLNIPYTGSGVLGSSLGMDKLRSKLVWRALGLTTPAFEILSDETSAMAAVDKLGLPLMVKPVLEGSSIGISKVTDATQMLAAYAEAAQFECDVIAEVFVSGDEYTVGILGEDVLPSIRIEVALAFYDFEAKYESGTTQYHCPSGLNERQEAHLGQLAKQAFDAIGLEGWGRVDFMLDENKMPYLIEVNTTPGMTEHSLVPKAACQVGLDFDALVLRILEQCK